MIVDLDEIKALECSLHGSGRADKQWLEKVLHQDFREITRSGVMVDRQYTVDALLTETQSSQHIIATDFRLQILSDTCVILTYRTVMRGESGNSRAALRSSCWTLTQDTGWQLAFHQGTPDVTGPA